MNSSAPDQNFSIFAAFADGLRLAHGHARLLAILSFLPFVVTLLTRVALRLLGTDLALFWLPVIQLPSSFVMGLQIALILRFTVLQEAPILDNGMARMQRNRSVMSSALVYTAITYFISGLYVGFVKLRDIAEANPEKVAPWMPLLLAVLVLFMWGSRWLWLHVPTALGWPSDTFYARLGRWGASLRIFCLFGLCSVSMNLIVTFLRVVIAAVAGEGAGGFAAAFDDGVIALASVILSVVFTTCTAAAIRSMSRGRDVWA